jgi:dihydrofolate reductase
MCLGSEFNSKFNIIVAHDQNYGIGINNALPWHLSQDMRYFKKVTLGTGENSVIMGRRTWESIPEKFRPLPQRKNIIMTHNDAYSSGHSVSIAQSLNEALQQASGKIFIIGGSTIYHEALQHPSCKTLYVTEIQESVNCDSFFPRYQDQFTLTNESDIHQENEYSFIFKTYQRNSY